LPDIFPRLPILFWVALGHLAVPLEYRRWWHRPNLLRELWILVALLLTVVHPKPDFDDDEFMLVSCPAFVSYQAAEAGVIAAGK
jgi:hypothetical protein